jgi:transcriptional regulator with XRE-family HTH domain
VNFGEKLKMLRTGQKLSQRELAERLGVAKSVISYYESGDRYPSYDVLVKMAHLFHVTTDYLLDIEKVRMIDVSKLSEEDIDVVVNVIKALENKKVSV